MTHTLKNTTDHPLSLYPFLAGGGKAFDVKLPIGGLAIGELQPDNRWLKTSLGGKTGFMDSKGCLLVDNGIVDPPPVVDPPPNPNPIPAPFLVSVNSASGIINSVAIDGDETKPFNIILNGRVIWP